MNQVPGPNPIDIGRPRDVWANLECPVGVSECEEIKFCRTVKPAQ